MRYLLSILFLLPVCCKAQTSLQVGGSSVNQPNYFIATVEMRKALALPYVPVTAGDTVVLMVTGDKVVGRLTKSMLRAWLEPRITEAQRNAIASPERGLRIYNLTTDSYNYYNGTAWKTDITDP